ncbi:MAG: NADH-quinone oxidoreductase subunit L [Candidatus Sericytochromatia bacterium]|nr:NADH-quinone oxidoreductase subunit L [Candidatus Sericytochromatia bacterium]
MTNSHLVSLIPLFPLVGATLLGLIALLWSHDERGFSKPVVASIACLGPILSCLVATRLFFGLADHPQGYVHTAFTWFSVGALHVPVEFWLDRLSGVMAMVVTFVGSLIHIYSVGYMSHERGFTRFFAYLNLFTFAMLVLVLGKNVPMMFLGWEGVGACSYLLIGYYFSETEKAMAANKAFIVNRVGDFGFLLGLFTLFWYLGSKGVWTVDFATIRAHADLIAPGMAAVIGLLLFVGAMGKSAQIPLHTWLADAMAGPTPVSALIHAATMVTAGVYMIARMAALYNVAPNAGHVIAVIGMATAIMAATIAITQHNIKKVLAYSTVSQLGYMFAAVGAGAYAAGVFHLFTHAFFKALLFLGAGAVIHAMHHEEEMDRYGGLWKKLPFTGTVMLVGCVAIAGIPPLAGFFSKDAVLFSQWEAGWSWLYGVGLFTSFLTAFYMFRMWFLTFLGTPRAPHLYAQAHEGPSVMNLPLAVLAFGTLVVGFLGLPEALGGSALAAWLAPAVGAHGHLPEGLSGTALKAATLSLHTREWLLASIAVVAGGLGILLAYLRHGPHRTPVFGRARGLFAVFQDRWYFDHVYDAVIVKPAIYFLGWGFRHAVEPLIDLVVLGVPALYGKFSATLRLVQTGAVRVYAYVMMVGLLLLLYLVLTSPTWSLLRVL